MNTHRIIKKILFTLCLAITTGPLSATETVKLGALAYGTVNWELETIENYKLDQKHGFKLDRRSLASPQSAKIAFQSEAVDIIVSDWVWVSNQRARGSNFAFSPYSTTSGALMVPTDSGISSLKDLAGKRIGIAGGELDKNWLLLNSLAKQQDQLDLSASVEKIYAAPPLLNQQLLNNKIDAVLTYWHYAARLKARGYRELLNGRSILSGLGIDLPLPTLGYVFRDDWAEKNRPLVLSFLAATVEAKKLLCETNSAWEAVVPLMRSEHKATQDIFRTKYCEGRIRQWDDQHRASAATVFALLHTAAGPRLTGPSPTLDSGTFWKK